jgi:hypothetical protein
MKMRVVGIVAGLLAVGFAAHAQNPIARPAPALTAAPVKIRTAAASKRAAKKTHNAATSPTVTPAPERTGTVSHRKQAAKTKSDHTPAAANAYASLPEADRLAIQSDLAWLGDYDNTAAGNLDDHIIDAIKAFQKRNGGRDTGILNDQERALLAAAVKAPKAAVGWRLLDDTETGARIGLPTRLVPKAGVGRTGSRWTSGQGQIQIETFRLNEAALPALFDEEKKTPRQRQVTYSALKPDSFVVAGEQKLKKFTVRAQASGTDVRGITILYDQATEGTMDRIAVAMANAFQGFPDPNVAPPAGTKRGVEYGTAIVVSERGYLIAPAPSTDECQAITVPGFGHAARIAVDKTGDLALLRLYGARNLAAAALSGESGKGDDLTLFGVAAPLAQAGAGAVTSTPAHRTPQGIEPAPKIGFSGAAAVDAQGRFVGMVELRPAVIAGTGAASTAPQATLVAADTIRNFLTSQGVALGAGHATMDQSVVRIICVRK